MSGVGRITSHIVFYLISVSYHCIHWHLFASPSFPPVCERLKTAPFDDFDPVLNHRHLQECLHKLLRVYALNGGTDRRAQLEFAVYYMLDHLGMRLGFTTRHLP